MPEIDSGWGRRFDWYQATIDGITDRSEPPHAVLARAARGSARRAKGRNGYAEAFEVVWPDETVAATVFGRSARLGEVHIEITSSSCDALVPVLRQRWPDHRVARVDSAVDFLADFDALDRVLVDFALRNGIKHRLTTDSDGGATRYLGSPRSELHTRVYKKTEQIRAQHPTRAAEFPDGVVRFEVVFRPGKAAVKSLAATMTPDDIWGCSGWSSRVSSELLGFQPQRTSTHFRKPSSWDRVLSTLGTQYGPSVEQRIAEVGRERAVLELLASLAPALEPAP